VTISTHVPESEKQHYNEVAARRGISLSELQRRALENECNGGSSPENELELLRDELAEKTEERRSTEREISKLESQIENIQKQLEREEEKQETYERLVDELANKKANGYPVRESNKFDRAVSLSEWHGELAVEKVLDEIRDLAGVQDNDTETEVIEETTDDYDFELNTGDGV